MRDEEDTDIPLSELLPHADAERLANQLATLVGAPLCIVDLEGTALAGAPLLLGTCPRVPLVVDLEPVGYLVADAPPPRLEAAAGLARLVLRAQLRYRLAAALHEQTVDEDYRRLLEKHAALEASEARYRGLAEQLERRVAEQVKTIEMAQRQLYQAEKLASVGQLAAGMAHEINTPIGFVRSNLAVASGYVDRLRQLGTNIATSSDGNLREQWRDADLNFVLEDFVQLLSESQSGVDRVARIVADLKAFSRVDARGKEHVDLNELIRSACNVAAPHLGERVSVEFALNPLPPLECDAAQISQVLLNLLLNSAEAIDGPGTVRFRTQAREQEIEITVGDTGAGIPPDVLPRIFDPFFTTKDVGQGTGLGLTVCYNVVKAHGGTINVDTKAGKGTTLTIILPLKSKGGRQE